jgi:tetratricopeptide (TPR) repeat protein
MQESDALYLRAVTSTVLRDFPPAIAAYQQISRQASDDQQKANVYFDLGRAYEKNDQLKEAKKNYQEATRLAPQEAASFLRLGVVCGALHDFICASDAFQKAESLYQNLSNLEGVTEVFCQRGFLYIYEIKPPEARAQLEKALEITKATGNQYQLIRVLQLLSTVSVLEGHIAQAEQRATEAVQLARNNGIENQATSGLIFLGTAFLWRGDYSDAERYYQQALQLAQRDKLRVSEAWALTQLGSLRSLQHKTDEALRYIEKALAFYQEGGYRKWLSLSLPILGRSYRDRGDYDAALNAFKQLHQLGEQLGDQAQAGLADVDIGNVLSYEEQYSEALRHFDESYRIFKSLKADSYIAYAAQNRASMLWQLGRAEEARAALDEAASIVEHQRDANKQLLAHIHLTNSLLELSDGHLPESKAESRKALEVAGNQYVDVAVHAKRTLALAQARSGSVRSARLLCEDAVNMASETGDPQLLSGSVLSLAEAMLACGELQSALDTALRAQESFARYGKSDSEWRAWLIAAEAARRLGNQTAVQEYSSRAVSRLSDLEQKWGSEAYNGYLARSDITQFRNRLDQLLKP